MRNLDEEDWREFFGIELDAGKPGSKAELG